MMRYLVTMDVCVELVDRIKKLPSTKRWNGVNGSDKDIAWSVTNRCMLEYVMCYS